ncbi:MAG: trypsin-like serine protease [Clostridiales bacterium]|nr:trypsin-like serine protease [Clostridiales bacterium]
MKKSFKIIIGIVFIIVCLLALTGCDSSLDKAYKQAVENGFVGTQTEWLASLTEGKSAYDIAVEEGFVGTEAEWLASLKGKDGKNGKDGFDGKDALSPTIEEIYQAAKEQGLVDSFDEFLKKYLEVNLNSIELAANIAMRSSVSVYCTSSAGSGVIYKLDKEKGDAYIITNHHVVYEASQPNKIAKSIKVYLYGKEYGPDSNSQFKEGEDLNYSIPAQFIGGSTTYDIAVLKVTGSEILKSSTIVRAINIGNSNHVPLGSTAIAIGNPSAKGLSVTSGIISVDSEHIVMRTVDETDTVAFRVQRTDSAINRGNSGGGLYNINGELIGIVNAKIASSEIENIGYAIPGNIAIGAAQNIIDNCDGVQNVKIKKAILGVTVRTTYSDVIDDDQTFLNIVNEITVDSFSENSIAESAGLEIGDKLIKVSMGGVEYELNRLFILSDLLFSAKENDIIVITVERMADGEAVEIPVEIKITASSITIID